jgi:hypothetical protein
MTVALSRRRDFAKELHGIVRAILRAADELGRT